MSRFAELLRIAEGLADPSKRPWGQADISGRGRDNYILAFDRDLGELGHAQWISQRDRLARAFAFPVEGRKWQAAFDILTEISAYAYLKRNFANRPEFVPPGTSEMPDLEIHLPEGGFVVCEAKTINLSDDELLFRGSGTSRNVVDYLSSGFFNGFGRSLEKAISQLRSYRPLEQINRTELVFIVIEFDDAGPEYKSKFWKQIDSFVLANVSGPLQIVAKERSQESVQYHTWSLPSGKVTR